MIPKGEYIGFVIQFNRSQPRGGVHARPLIDCAFACVQFDGLIYCFPITNTSNYNITFTCSFQHDLKRVFFCPPFKMEILPYIKRRLKYCIMNGGYEFPMQSDIIETDFGGGFHHILFFFLVRKWDSNHIHFLLVIEFRQVASRLRMDFYVGLVGVVNAQASLLSIFNLFTSCHAHLGVHI